MKRTIEKFAPIEHPSLTLLKEYFENLEIDLANQPKVSNFTVYIKDGETTLGKNLLEDLKKTFLSHFLPQEIFDSIYEAIDYIKSQYDVRIMWLMFYQPKTNLAFHIDSDYNRYAISIFDNERFFNYECTQLNYDNVQMYSEEMNKHIDNIDTYKKRNKNRSLTLKLLKNKFYENPLKYKKDLCYYATTKHVSSDVRKKARLICKKYNINYAEWLKNESKKIDFDFSDFTY